MTEHIRMAHEGTVAMVTIDRATHGNVLTLDMLRALAATIRSAGASDAKVLPHMPWPPTMELGSVTPELHSVSGGFPCDEAFSC